MLATVLMGLAPKLVPMVTGKVADVAINTIAEKLGVEPTEKSIEDHLVAHPEDIVKLEQIDLEKLEAKLADTANAREMQKEAMKSEDPWIRRFVYLFAWFWSVTAMIYFFGVTFIDVSATGKEFANFILGFLTGTAVSTIIGFFYGGAITGGDKK